MSFNRTIYDSCAYATQLQSSTSPLEYNLFTSKYQNCKTCPLVEGSTNNINFGDKVNIENELQGLNRQLSRCPEKKFDPKSSVPTSNFVPARLCESIYYINPTNMKMPKSNGLNENILGTNACGK
jgi:hypothetical protein